MVDKKIPKTDLESLIHNAVAEQLAATKAAEDKAAADKTDLANRTKQAVSEPDGLQSMVAAVVQSQLAQKGAGASTTGGKTSAKTSSGLPSGSFSAVADPSNRDGNKLEGPVTPELIAQEKKNFITNYGGVAAMASSQPWLNTILNQAIAGNWTADKFTKAVSNAPEWGTFGKSTQDYYTGFYGDPTHQAWAQQYDDKLKILQNQARLAGYDPSVFGNFLGPNPTQDAINKVFNGNDGTTQFLKQYYSNMPDATTLSTWVATHATMAKQADGFTPEGQLATQAANLKSYAQQYGLNPNTLPKQWSGAAGQGASTGDYFSSAADAIAKGYTTADSEQAAMRAQAVGIYKPFATQIGNGMSVAQLAQPYTNAASNLLEKSGDSFTLGDYTGVNGLLTKALTGDGTQSIPLDQFMTQIKKDPAWLLTGNARNSIMDTASQLLGGMGMVN